MSTSKRTLRVFVSYPSGDQVHAQSVFAHLRKLNCAPFDEFTPGQRFDEGIRRLIEYSHVFMPLLTKGGEPDDDGEPRIDSDRKPWVNQEIGYALGRNVPFLPLGLDTDPTGFATTTHAVKLAADLSDLEEKLTRVTLERAFARALVRA